MAGNQVTLTFAGDSTSLERSMGRVGSASRDMGRDAAGGFDRVGESADNVDTRAMGFRDTITGLQDLNRGLTGDFDSLGDQLFMIGMGFGDLASGVANFGVQFAKQIGTFVVNSAKMVATHATTVASTVAGWVVMGVQATVNAVKMAAAWLISLGPVGLVIAAVAAVIAILVALGVGFDDIKRWAQTAWEFILGIIQGAFAWISDNWPLILAILTGPFGLAVLAISRNWESIKSGFTAVKDWISSTIGTIVGFFAGLPGRITSAVSGLWDGIISGFKSAINAVIGLWNGFSISFGGYDIPGPGPNIPSFSINTPNIPYLHTGGVYQAPRGQREGLAMLLDGERVLSPGQSKGGGATVNVYVAGSIRSDRDLVRLFRDELDRGGFGGVFA